ncbi:lipoyl(octanoyl) transferase LipB [Haloferula sp.]|uniref:lipoyl(octanoyl) transferase LipB n=1 Tax=Haloferula sp. TaxID=2497595 RepID=UPI00329CB136
MKISQLSTPVPYADGLALQQDTVAGILDGSAEETLFLLEHEPVYTIGRRRDQSSLKDSDSLPAPVHEINRGGQATYHGPGQLVGYPILDLRHRGKDLHEHLRKLEEALILTCHDFDIPATRREGLTGVWVQNRKLASIGVGVSKWISMHGFAMNVTKECLLPFFAITPCGIDGVVMSCVENEADRPISVAEFSSAFLPHFEALFHETNS